MIERWRDIKLKKSEKKEKEHYLHMDPVSLLGLETVLGFHKTEAIGEAGWRLRGLKCEGYGTPSHLLKVNHVQYIFISK